MHRIPVVKPLLTAWSLEEGVSSFGQVLHGQQPVVQDSAGGCNGPAATVFGGLP